MWCVCMCDVVGVFVCVVRSVFWVWVLYVVCLCVVCVSGVWVVGAC